MVLLSWKFLVCSGMLMKFSCCCCVSVLYMMKLGIGVSIVVLGWVMVIVSSFISLFELLFSVMLILLFMLVWCVRVWVSLVVCLVG